MCRLIRPAQRRVVPLPTTFQTAGTAVTAKAASANPGHAIGLRTRQLGRSVFTAGGGHPGPARQARPPPAPSSPPELSPAAPGFHRAMPPRQTTPRGPPGRSPVSRQRYPTPPATGNRRETQRSLHCRSRRFDLQRNPSPTLPKRPARAAREAAQAFEPGGAAIVLVGHRRRFVTEAFDHRMRIPVPMSRRTYRSFFRVS